MVGLPINMWYWLVFEPYPSEKYDFVSWDDDIPNWMESHKSHVLNHQAVFVYLWSKHVATSTNTWWFRNGVFLNSGPTICRRCPDLDLRSPSSTYPRWVYQMDLSQNWVYRNHPESPENSDVVFFCQWEKCDGNIWCSQPWCLGFPWLFHRFSPNLSTPWVERPTPPPMVMPSRRLTWQQPGAGDIWGSVGWLGTAWNFNGNFRILKWRYVSTICLAIFCWDIPLHRPYIGLIYGRYLQWIGSWHGHW